MSVDGFRLRPLQSGDIPFVMSTWLKSLWDSRGPATSCVVGGKQQRYISNSTFFREHHRVATELVKKCGVIIAEVEGAEDEIAGYICGGRKDTVQGEQFVAHYVYTKPLYRKLGIARWLVEAAGWKPGEDIVATHVTYIQTDGKLTKRYPIENNPYLIWR